MPRQAAKRSHKGRSAGCRACSGIWLRAVDRRTPWRLMPSMTAWKVDGKSIAAPVRPARGGAGEGEEGQA